MRAAESLSAAAGIRNVWNTEGSPCRVFGFLIETASLSCRRIRAVVRRSTAAAS